MDSVQYQEGTINNNNTNNNEKLETVQEGEQQPLTTQHVVVTSSNSVNKTAQHHHNVSNNSTASRLKAAQLLKTALGISASPQSQQQQQLQYQQQVQQNGSMRSKGKSVQYGQVTPDKLARSLKSFDSDKSLHNSAQSPGQSKSGFKRYKTETQQSMWLTFLDDKLEQQYQRYLISRTQFPAKVVIWLTLFGLVFIYTSALITNPIDSLAYTQNYKNKTVPIDDMAVNNSALCTPGYFCQPCPNFFLCYDYKAWVDWIFLTVSVLTCITLLFYVHTLKPSNPWVKHYNLFLSMFVVLIGVVSVITRFSVVLSLENYVLSSVFCLLIINTLANGLTLRYSYALVSLSAIAFAWFISVFPLDSSKFGINQWKQKLSIGMALIVSLVGSVWHLYILETFYREQFLRQQFAAKVNLKLVNQLKALQRTYTTGAVDLESPLEKALQLLRSMMADPSLSSEQSHSFEIILQLLNSPQLYNPDLEGQFDMIPDAINPSRPSASGAIDNEQKAWLMNETSRRKTDFKPSLTVRRPRRGSLFTSREGKDGQSEISLSIQAADSPQLPVLPTIEVTRDGGSLSKATSKVAMSTRMEPAIQEARTFEQNPELTKTGFVTAVDTHPQQQDVIIKDGGDSSIPINHKDPFSFITGKLITLTSSQREDQHLDQAETEKPTLASNLAAGNISTIVKPKSGSRSVMYQLGTIQNLLQSVSEWNWKLFDFAEACPGGKPLFLLTWHMFDANCLFDEFKIQYEKFNNFIWKIQEGYRELPYHNSFHAADVLHAVNYFTQFDRISALITPMELMAMYVAAAIHDFDHPGVNNNFLVSTTNPLAVLYNDKAVLENYHLSAAFQTLQQEECNFLSHLQRPEWQAFRDLVIEMVLATDLSQHYTILSQFKTRLQNSFNPAESREDKLLLMKMLIKCSDVSNPTKEFSLYMKWTNAVIDEWRIQGDQEKALNIPVSPFMDRDNPNVLVSSQNGFIDFIIVPMYDALHNGYLSLPLPMEQLERNKQHFLRLKENKDVTPAGTMSRKSDIGTPVRVAELQQPVDANTSKSAEQQKQE
ncbi:hypothetical protein MP228_008836 [Amoeboaphelidium protococcarum]|nr:hypothetical protein MP228_008836 [Amoeboaphelidium protococcarum]